jgi:hypothetical protein
MTEPPRLRPVDVLRALADLLRARGITRLYGSACTMLGVLSVANGLSVWTDGRQLWWRTGDNQTTWPATDPNSAARLLTTLTQDPESAEPLDGLPPGR